MCPNLAPNPDPPKGGEGKGKGKGMNLENIHIINLLQSNNIFFFTLNIIGATIIPTLYY
jgi:hypothetical protein